MSPLNVDVIERELTELASSNNGNWNELDVGDLVSTIDCTSHGLTPIKSIPGLLKDTRHPAILKSGKRRQQLVNYETPPSMKKNFSLYSLMDSSYLQEEMQPQHHQQPLAQLQNNEQQINLKSLPFSPTQVRDH